MTNGQLESFRTQGYAIVPGAIDDGTLDVLRHELDRYLTEIDAEMDAAGTDVLGLSHRGRRYFVGNRVLRSEALASFVFSDVMASICQATLGDDVWFMLEQFVVKFAEVGMTFSWHQDSGYLKHTIPTHALPYLSCWCALDDMTEENGTIYVLPYDRAGGPGIIDHVREAATNDLVGYWGDDPGDPIIVSAGDIVVFSSTSMHRSGANTTDAPRRSYLCQYTAEPILRPDGTPHINAIPFLAEGRRVAYEGAAP